LDPRKTPAFNEAARFQAVSGSPSKAFWGLSSATWPIHEQKLYLASMFANRTSPNFLLPTHTASIPTIKKLRPIHNRPTAENLFKSPDMKPESVSAFYQSEATFDSSGMV
jgi:hypothetical protein